MSWSHCGTDKQGRLIGYAHEATCDHEDCNRSIDRGLSYSCEGYGITEFVVGNVNTNYQSVNVV